MTDRNKVRVELRRVEPSPGLRQPIKSQR